MHRIVILGCAGTGKTTFARKLGKHLAVPVIILDSIWPTPLTKEDMPAFRTLIEQAHAGESWISDGNFAAATFDLRLPRATEIVWLEAPRLTCMSRVVLRAFRKGEPHRLRNLGRVLAYIRRFDRVNRPLIEAKRLEHGPNLPLHRLQSNLDRGTFLARRSSGK